MSVRAEGPRLLAVSSFLSRCIPRRRFDGRVIKLGTPARDCLRPFPPIGMPTHSRPSPVRRVRRAARGSPPKSAWDRNRGIPRPRLRLVPAPREDDRYRAFGRLPQRLPHPSREHSRAPHRWSPTQLGGRIRSLVTASASRDGRLMRLPRNPCRKAGRGEEDESPLINRESSRPRARLP